MTTLRYILAPGSGASLDYLFISLLQERRSEADALKVVSWVIANDRDIRPSIPPGSKPLAEGNNLEIEFPDHSRFPAGLFFIPRVYYPTNLLPAVVAPATEQAPPPMTPEARELARAQAHERREAQRAIHQQRLEQSRQQDRAILEEMRRAEAPAPPVVSGDAKPVAPSGIEEQGIALLVKRLKRHQARGYTKPKAFYRKLLKRVLKISDWKFDSVVWPTGIKAQDVQQPKSGRPSKKK